MKTIHVQCIKSGTLHEQYPARRSVSSINDDVRGLAGISLWSQKNDTPHNIVKSTTTRNKQNIDTKKWRKIRNMKTLDLKTIK
jgi:hypothetical protein